MTHSASFYDYRIYNTGYSIKKLKVFGKVYSYETQYVYITDNEI